MKNALFMALATFAASALMASGAQAKVVHHAHHIHHAPVAVAPAAPAMTCEAKLDAANAYGICGQECRATHTSGGGITNETCMPDCLARFCQN